VGLPGLTALRVAQVLPQYILAQPARYRQLHLGLQFLACTLSRCLNLFWFFKIVRIVLRGGAKTYIDESKMD